MLESLLASLELATLGGAGRIIFVVDAGVGSDSDSESEEEEPEAEEMEACRRRCLLRLGFAEVAGAILARAERRQHFSVLLS